MKKYLTDIEIARQATKININEVASKVGLKEADLSLYGKYMAKVNIEKFSDSPKGKLILITATSPTPAGEGKTTMTIGLNDGLNLIGKKTIAALREPSLGPVFGIKGGAAGGGKSQIVPIEDINLHFTGDLHAITSANNLIAAMVDNHIYWGNQLNIKNVVWKRCLDINDRSLRRVSYKIRDIEINTGFQITAASEIMGTVSLALNLNDLRIRIDKLIIAYNSQNKPIFVKDIKATGSVMALLKDAMNPNLVQTLEHNPALVHFGPFANIAHGCNSIIATKLALQTAEYVVTEAGFGSDLGAEKFLNIKARTAMLKPGAIVLVTTIKALKMHGGLSKDELSNENIEVLIKGIPNLEQHFNSLTNFGIPIVVALNYFVNDSEAEIKVIRDWAESKGVRFEISKSWEFGGDGAKELAQAVIDVFDAKTPKFTYEASDSIEEKIIKVAENVYGASGIIVSPEAKEKITLLKKNGLDKQLICIAKTPVSFSDNAKLLGAPKGWKLNIKDININNGASFIIVITGSVMTMPGLGKIPSAEKINVIDGEIINLS